MGERGEGRGFGRSGLDYCIDSEKRGRLYLVPAIIAWVGKRHK